MEEGMENGGGNGEWRREWRMEEGVENGGGSGEWRREWRMEEGVENGGGNGEWRRGSLSLPHKNLESEETTSQGDIRSYGNLNGFGCVMRIDVDERCSIASTVKVDVHKLVTLQEGEGRREKVGEGRQGGRRRTGQ
eukprot:763479-Hanusia_phi.AAC.2